MQRGALLLLRAAQVVPVLFTFRNINVSEKHAGHAPVNGQGAGSLPLAICIAPSRAEPILLVRKAARFSLSRFSGKSELSTLYPLAFRVSSFEFRVPSSEFRVRVLTFSSKIELPSFVYEWGAGNDKS